MGASANELISRSGGVKRNYTSNFTDNNNFALQCLAMAESRLCHHLITKKRGTPHRNSPDRER